ncbi:MAG: hypothetical protein IJR14_06325, partial [Synergistaceae bacterium]|nr:hypothetical protein [Synergistaceae bacterium]
MSMLVKVALFIVSFVVSSLFLGDDVVLRAEEPTSVVELDAATATGPTSPDVASEGTDAEDQLTAREAALAKREAELAAREAKLVDEMKAKGAEDQLAEREAALIRREAELAAREKEALAAQLEERERELARREAELKERSAAIQVKEDALMGSAVAKAPGIAEPDVGPGSVITETEKGLVDWTQNYVEATGMAVAPTGKKGAQAKALARRGAILDLQRNLLEFLVGVQIDAYTTMEDFMASDKVRSEIHGIIKNVETIHGDWDGEAYTVKGRIRMGQIRMVMA